MYAPAYEAVVQFKGSILQRQRVLRAVADSPGQRELWDDLQRAAAALAAHSRRQPAAGAQDQWQSELQELSRKRVAAEARLVQQSAKYRAAREGVTVAQIQASLPHDAVLLDYCEYDKLDFPQPGERPTADVERRLCAFVLRSGKSPTLIDLGPVEPIRTAIDAWRGNLGGEGQSLEAARKVASLVWQPLHQHLADAKLVLVSPDGDLSRTPLAALPGTKAGSYLIEERSIALIPSAQALPELLRDDPVQAVATGNLLLVGGVDYDTRAAEKARPAARPFADFAHVGDGPPQPAARGQEQLSFRPLEGSKEEIDGIEGLYKQFIDAESRRLTLLQAAAASEAAVRREAPRHYYLHFATHGFFAPEEIRSALSRSAQAGSPLSSEFVTQQSIAGYNPGLLSGIALAGASQPDPQGDDGILTADEVSTLDLRGVKLAVLSACETGLGEVAGGEGLLGLQRSFQAAGAHTVVASLWKVNDLVTRDLMKRFYDNLWNKRMSKIESLRKAQLWLLRERGSRGLLQVDTRAPNGQRLAPFYWAAFTLSGDWR